MNDQPLYNIRFEEFFHREAYRLSLTPQWSPFASIGTAEIGSGTIAQITRVEDTSGISIFLAIGHTGHTLRRVFLYFSNATGSAVIAVSNFGIPFRKIEKATKVWRFFSVFQDRF